MEKKNAIINSARILFARYGYNKTSVDEIARKSHIAKSTIYSYFRSKEDIFKEVIYQESRILYEEINNAICKESNPSEKLRAYVITKMKYLKKMVNYYSTLKDEYWEHYSFIEKIRRKSTREELKIVKAILKEGVSRGDFTIKDVNLTSFAIVTAVKGLEYQWAVDFEMSKIHKNIDYLLDVLFNGIKKR